MQTIENNVVDGKLRGTPVLQCVEISLPLGSTATISPSSTMSLWVADFTAIARYPSSLGSSNHLPRFAGKVETMTGRIGAMQRVVFVGEYF